VSNISQGSVATHVKNDDIYNDILSYSNLDYLVLCLL